MNAVNLLRQLQDDGGNGTIENFPPSFSPSLSPSNSPFTEPPVPQEETPVPDNDDSSFLETYGRVLILAGSVALIMLFAYRCYVECLRRLERREMELVNTQADNVLGDMAMIPTQLDSDDEEDAELI